MIFGQGVVLSVVLAVSVGSAAAQVDTDVIELPVHLREPLSDRPQFTPAAHTSFGARGTPARVFGTVGEHDRLRATGYTRIGYVILRRDAAKRYKRDATTELCKEAGRRGGDVITIQQTDREGLVQFSLRSTRCLASHTEVREDCRGGICTRREVDVCESWAWDVVDMRVLQSAAWVWRLEQGGARH